jgi:hypothetical protein
MPTPNQYPLSVVITARNDDYGGNLINRINTSLKVLSAWAEQLQRHIEMIIVDYNPVVGKKLLADELNNVNNTYFEARFIIVPVSGQGHEKTPLREYLAKNIGIRRARGEYILATNPDIIFSRDMIDFITSKLEPGCYYRADRFDLKLSKFPENLNINKILTLCRKNAYLRLGQYKNAALTFKYQAIEMIKYLKSIIRHPKRLLPPKNKEVASPIHTNASGDFLLMHRDLWEKLKGYDESTIGATCTDGYLLHCAYCFDMPQQIIPFPIYHIYHNFGRQGRPEIEYQEYRRNCEAMIKTKIPYHLNGQDWGRATDKFQEVAWQ